ncbi:MAG: BTAD domain-containing putative transcriptional regulator [Chloroflexota bacterium]
MNQIPLASLETVKASALVYYLAVTERVHGRAELAELFWPDSELKLARRNLRNRLVVIRNHLGDYFTITRESLQFKPHFANQVDIHQLAAAASAAECTADRARLRQTADLYRGDFLTNIHVTDAPLFEDWVTRTREETHTQMATILYRLSHLEAAQGNLAQANTDIDRLLSLVPWHEEAHRLKMQLLYQNGHRWAALEQYAALQDILREELDVPPDAETEHLINLIRLGESLEDTVLALPDKSPVQTNIHAPTMTHTPENIEPGTIDTGTIDAGTIDTADINATDINTADINAVDIDAVDIDATDIELALDKTDAQMASPTYQSPIPLTPLIGRGELLRTILDAIQDPTHRLITLMGMGGVGKTHMALTIGQRMRELQRADRNDEQVDIYFISLVGMEAMPRASQSETIPYAHEKQA